MDDERTVTRSIAGQRCTHRIKSDSAGVDRAIVDLAEKQHGVVGRKQLLDVGVKLNAIEGRLRRGQLHAVHRGVYAVGHRALGLEGRLLALCWHAGQELC